jgi:gliding motility-associated-like protein
MRLNLLRLLFITGSFFLLSFNSKAQNCIPTNINGTTINLLCNQVCSTLVFQLPHIKSSSNYSLNTIPYIPYPYTTPGGNELTLLYDDDEFSNVINIPFGFCFYDSIFYAFTVGSNGVMTFDTTNKAPCDNSYLISAAIPAIPGSGGGGQCTRAGPYYPRASIMGNFQDLDPSPGPSNPGSRKIEWRLEGTAPCRRIIVSYYDVGIFGGSCGASFPNTFQMVIYESTGIVDIFSEIKSLCTSSSSNGRAIFGIQDWAWSKEVSISARNPGQWTASNEAYRFTPSGGSSRYVISELLDMSATVVATGDTITTTPGLLDIRFINFCPAPGSNQYVVRTRFSACDNPINQLISLDTITINRTTSLGATATTTNASCGPPDGTITINVPPGIGTPPYTYVLDGGAPVVAPSPYTFTNVGAGPHTIVVTDASAGCTSTINVTITLSGNIPATTTTTPTACPGINNGSITITSAGGSGPYTFSLDGAPAVAGTIPFTFTNLAAGNHTILVTDIGLGCSTVLMPVFVPTGIGITATLVETPTTCPGAANGTITVTALSGVPPFTWSLDGGPFLPGASPYTFTNVSSGPHVVRITDNIGCQSAFNANVGAGPGINGSTSSTATSCVGANNGSITATALSGTAPFTWSLDGAPAVAGASPYTFTNVAAGLHTILITDNTGCNVILTETVAAGAGNTGSATSTPTSCPAVSNGTITATALTGTAPFMWSLDGAPAVPGASPFTFTNVAVGLHTITITDINGCNVLLTETVMAGAGVNANLSSSATACAGVNNGTITVDATTGTAPFTYSLDGGPPQSGANPYTFTNVAAGLHTILVTDNVGCTYTNTVTVSVGTGVSGNGSSTPTSCPTANNGTVTADATSGTAPFTYSLDGGAPQSGANPYTFTNVPAGPHTVTITDNFGCNIIINVIVVAGPALTANVTSSATSCSGATNGTITVTPTSGTAPYTWSLDGAPAVPGASPFTFTNVPAGNHTVVVTDAVSCVTNSIPVTVNAGPTLTTTVTVTDALCNGGATGRITVNQPAIGVPPFQYSLDGIIWQASNIFNGLIAGNYTVYFRESLGCQGSQPVTVSEPSAMTSSAATVAAICNGQPDGIITITAGGGIAPYQYSIDGGVNWQASNIFNRGAGTYTIIIRDANNCTRSQSATVTEPALLTANSVNSNASCDGGNDGVITVNAAGGNSGYAYSIDGVNFQASNIFNVAPGPYTITVRDNLGCIASFNTVVGLTNNLTFTPQVDPTICEGSSTQLQLISNATDYLWTPATGLSSTTISNPVANPMVTTQYTVTATLGRCSANDIVIVNVNTAPVPDAGPDGFICYGQTYQLQGSGGVQYTWTPSTNLSSTTISNPISTPVKTITYTLSEVIDAAGCKSLTTDQVTVDVTPPIKVKTFPYDTIGYPGDQFQLNATSAATFYSWSPAIGLSNPNIANPVVTVGPLGSDILYQVTASTAAGCKGEGYVNLKVYNGPELYTPSGFTPNGDGLNDLFYPFPVGIRSINYFRVFNRWGQMVFSSSTLYKGWDGKLQGVEQPSGTYVYMAEGVDKNGKLLTKKGTITLIR